MAKNHTIVPAAAESMEDVFVRVLRGGRLAVTLMDCVEHPELGRVMAYMALHGNYWAFDNETDCYVAPAPDGQRE